MINLDFLCMKTAQEMVTCQGTSGDKESVATKGLGVLLENGPYGFMLYLQTHAKGTIAGHYKEKLIALCREELVASYISGGVPASCGFEEITTWLRVLAEDLDGYLFTKRLWQQVLIYTRYHAKALDEEDETAQAEEQENTL